MGRMQILNATMHSISKQNGTVGMTTLHDSLIQSNKLSQFCSSWLKLIL